MAFGVNITTSEAPQASGPSTSTGTAFVAGVADQGPATATLCYSINDVTLNFGARTTGNSALYDWADVFFRERGQALYAARVSDSTATSATLTLNDAGARPSVVVSALTPGVAGNSTYIAVTNGTGATLTANTTTSTAVSAVSSFANIAVGTPVTGTGIPANTYVASINTTARTLVLSAAATATATAVTLTPGTLSVSVQDSSGNVLESHGPFRATAQLFADASAYATFSQSAGSGFTANVPPASAAAALTGGADASDLTDASAVTTLTTAFPSTLGPGQVALAGYTSQTAWNGLKAFARATGRFALLDTADQPTVTAAIAAIGSTGTASDAGWCLFTDGTVQVPGVVPGTSRTVASSAVVAALCAQVAQTGNDNQMPAGQRWPLQYVTGFTSPRSFADIATLNGVGISPWANRYGTLCLYGFSTPVLPTTDPIFWNAAASRERMALVADSNAIAEPFMFDVIDGQGLTLTALKGQLAALLASHWAAGALFGSSALDAGSVSIASPFNTTSTESLGQLNAGLEVKISPSVEAVNLALVFYPVTSALV